MLNIYEFLVFLFYCYFFFPSYLSFLLLLFLIIEFFKRFHLFIFQIEGKGGRKRGKHWCARETWIGCLSHAPNWGTGLTTQLCALTGNLTSDLSVCSTALPHTNQSSQLLNFEDICFSSYFNLIFFCTINLLKKNVWVVSLAFGHTPSVTALI